MVAARPLITDSRRSKPPNVVIPDWIATRARPHDMTLLTLIAEAPAAASAGVQVWARTVPDLFDDEVHAHADEVVTKTGLLQYMEGQAGRTSIAFQGLDSHHPSSTSSGSQHCYQHTTYPTVPYLTALP